MKNEFGNDILLGAGTVLSIKDLEMAKEKGAKFILSPNVDQEVIRRTKEMELVSIPGAMTPSEIVTASNAGADIVKVFPIANLGIKFFKSIIGPLSHYKYSAVGGISIKNIDEFIKEGFFCVGVGGGLVKKDFIRDKRFNQLTDLGKQFVYKINN